MSENKMKDVSLSHQNSNTGEISYAFQPPSMSVEALAPKRYSIYVPERGPAYCVGDTDFHTKRNEDTVNKYNFDGCRQKEICINDLEAFFRSKQMYRNFGIPYKRGIILYGPPGTGKSAIALAMEVRAIKMGIPVFRIRNQVEMQALSDIRDEFNKVVIIEQIERYVGDLSLDIDDLPGQTFIIGTTNEPSKMHDRITKRPGRFDRIIKIDRMTAGMLKMMAERFNLSSFIDKLKEYPVITPAQMAEISLRHNVYGYEANEAIESVIKEFYG